MLVKQDQAEAKQNVNTRLDFIRSEMCVARPLHILLHSHSTRRSKRVENQLKELGEKAEKKKLEVRTRSASSTLTPTHLPVSQLVEIQAALQQQTAPAPA